jgi:hypothetical protein
MSANKDPPRSLSNELSNELAHLDSSNEFDFNTTDLEEGSAPPPSTSPQGSASAPPPATSPQGSASAPPPGSASAGNPDPKLVDMGKKILKNIEEFPTCYNFEEFKLKVDMETKYGTEPLVDLRSEIQKIKEDDLKNIAIFLLSNKTHIDALEDIIEEVEKKMKGRAIMPRSISCDKFTSMQVISKLIRKIYPGLIHCDDIFTKIKGLFYVLCSKYKHADKTNKAGKVKPSFTELYFILISVMLFKYAEECREKILKDKDDAGKLVETEGGRT